MTVDGRQVLRPAARLREGATVNVTFPPSTLHRTRPAAEPGVLEVVHEDGSLMVVNKPAGVVVHPSYKQLSGTLLNAVLWRTRTRDDVQPGIVTRLDKDTSGLVLVALTPSVHAALQRSVIEKSYLAIVRGVPRPEQGRIRRPLGRDPNDRRRMVVDAGRCGQRDTIRGDLRTSVGTGPRIARAMRARDRANAPDSRPPCVERLADRRRSDLWSR